MGLRYASVLDNDNAYSLIIYQRAYTAKTSHKDILSSFLPARWSLKRLTATGNVGSYF